MGLFFTSLLDNSKMEWMWSDRDLQDLAASATNDTEEGKSDPIPEFDQTTGMFSIDGTLIIPPVFF